MINFDDISLLAMEATDLEESGRFYCEVLGMEELHRDQGEKGQGRIVLKNGTGQLLFLEKVDQLSSRSRFRSFDPEKVPDPAGAPRHVGAHLAMSVGSIEEYDDVYERLQRYGVYSEGDILADRRAPGQKSDYFYDPSGNRLQLIILPGVGQDG